MKKYTNNIFLSTLFTLILLSSCASHYKLSSIQRTRLVVDSQYDTPQNPAITDMMQPYKAYTDSMMNPIVGTIACDMSVKRPESLLSNLLADILIWGANQVGQYPDFAVYNMGGIRASLSKGNVTIGNILDVAPFENKLCVLSLKGSEVVTLFQQIASTGGEAVSSGVELVINKNRKLVSAKLNGNPIDTNKQYRIATLDYLAQGNDKLLAFKQKTEVFSPQNYHSNVRFIIEEYFKQQSAEGKIIDSKLENRIIIQP